MMKFGIFDHLDDCGAGLGKLFDDRLRLAEAYDRAGFYGYHIAEHHSTPLGFAPSPGIFLSAVAQRTRQLRFGPLVYLLPFYHPLRLLEEICMLDQLSHGRFQLGVGRGISPIEAGFYGIEPGNAPEMYQEALQVLLKGLTAEGELSFDGAYYKFRDVPLTLRPVQQPHPPLWYGLSSIESVDWAAAHDVNVVTLALPAHARALTDRYRATWRSLGKDPDNLPLMGISRHIVVAESDEAASTMAGRAYPRWRAAFNHLWQRYAPDAQRSPIARLYPETFAELQAMGNGFAGSPRAVRKYLEAQIDASGVTYVMAWFAFGDLTLEESLRSVALFAEEVMPHFSDHKGSANTD